MKKKLILIFSVFLLLSIYTAKSQQIFPSPTGKSGELNDKNKSIDYSFKDITVFPPILCQSISSPLLLKKKYPSTNRRYHFAAKFNSDVWNDGDCGWNKLARIAFKDYQKDDKGSWNKYKMHVGWRSSDIENNIRLSLYFHNQHESNYVSHEFAVVTVNNRFDVDMFLGVNILAMIIGNKALGIRYKDYFYQQSGSKSAIKRTFFYGGSCCPPDNSDMEVEFTNQTYDKNGFLNRFNSQDYMTWNLSEFESGDIEQFYAKKEINGSIENTNLVQASESNFVKQKCIIKEGADISFTAGESVHLYHGFHAKSGSHFRASICPPIKILSTPAEYEKPFCYTVENVTSAKLRVEFHVGGNNYFIGFYSGIILGNHVCFDIVFFEDPFEYGYYKLDATFYNKCMKKTITQDFVVQGKKTAPKKDSLSGSNPVIHFAKTDSTFTLDKAVFRGDEFVIYPNPNTGLLKLSAPDNFHGKYSVRIYNSMGIPILQKENLSAEVSSIDLSAYAKGVYFVKIITHDRTLMRKILLQ